MRSVIVIPARMAATRLPDKPLAVLGGLPLVVQVARQAHKSRADHVVIATDSDAVRWAAKEHNIAAVLTHPHHPSGSDRVLEAISHSAADADIVINLQGDEPFIDPRDLNGLIDRLADTVSTADMATLRTPITDVQSWHDTNTVKVVSDDQGRALYFSRAPIPFARDTEQGADTAGLFRHIGVYAYRRAALEAFCAAPVHALEAREKLEQLRALALGLTIAVVDAHSVGRGIDTPDDLRWAQARVERLGAAAFPPAAPQG